ncbi:hypothetical protein Q5752_004018 [Cryptotrichosporon argae]
MPTLLTRTKQHFTGAPGVPLHMTDEMREARILEDFGAGRTIGEQPSRKSTPSKVSEALDRTPSETWLTLVLPWVQDVVDQDFDLPEGMLGPYDSQPPTRPQTILHSPSTPPQKQIHPFAYTTAGTVPFAALATGDAYEPAFAEVIAEVEADSEVLSRGAGVRSLHQPPAMRAGESGVGRVSPDVGTFGRNDSVAPVSKVSTSIVSGLWQTPRESPLRRQIQSDPHTPRQATPVASPKPKSTASYRVPVPPLELDAAPHVHHPHHDFPFSHAQAAAKQSEAMERARAEALAQLEASAGAPEAASGFKGPRQTYETTTSGPSFGHILHKDGKPVPPRMSVQTAALDPGADARRIAGLSTGSFTRIPFGVPLGATLPRPLMVLSGGVGLGFGVGLPSRMGNLSHIAESPEYAPPQARSAFVESVEDEEAPTHNKARTYTKVPTAKSGKTARAKSASPVDDAMPARTESAVLRQSMEQPYRSHKPTGPITPPPQFAPPITASVRTTTYEAQPDGHYQPVAQTTTQSIVVPPAPRTHYSKAQSVTSDRRTRASSDRTATPQPLLAGPPSVAPTTATNVNKIVADSSFHDETLCQLLDAARLNLIGDAAKKALMRAARARVVELKDLKDQGEADIPMPSIEPPKERTPRKEKKSSKGRVRSKSHDRKKASSSPATSEKAATIVPEAPPPWAQEIITRLEAFDTRFVELEKQGLDAAADNDTPPSQDVPTELIEDLLFHQMPSSGFGGIAGLPFGRLFGNPVMSPDGATPQGAYLRTLSPTEAHDATPPEIAGSAAAPSTRAPTAQSAHAPTAASVPAPNGFAHAASAASAQQAAGSPKRGGDIMSWGSSVELPHPGDTVLPPRPPTITIQAPTESHAPTTHGFLASRAASAASPTTHTPGRIDVDIYEERVEQLPSAQGPSVVPDPSERDLPALPSDSVRSNRPSPVPSTPSPLIQKTPTPTHRATPRNDSPRSRYGDGTQASPDTYPIVRESEIRPAGATRDKLNLIDPLCPPMPEPAPWDLVTQRLYSWALVWEDDTFVRGLENISLGKQVEEFPLTVFAMMTFKRNLRHRMTNTPPLPCDKLFVPPNLADGINKAVHAKRFGDAQQILEELWYPFQFQDPPRIIISLTRHGAQDAWLANRYDLATGRLTSYFVSHEASRKDLLDGRPFMWWHAIRLAWPQQQIPHPDMLDYTIKTVGVTPENRNDASLRAAVVSRNLLLGIRPEHEHDLSKLREYIWSEVKRLAVKKRQGKLIVHMDSDDHVDEL